MAIERKGLWSDTPGIGWLCGLGLVAAVVVIGVVVPAAVLLFLGGNPIWSVAVMAGGVLIAWTVFIVILRLGRGGPGGGS